MATNVYISLGTSTLGGWAPAVAAGDVTISFELGQSTLTGNAPETILCGAIEIEIVLGQSSLAGDAPGAIVTEVRLSGRYLEFKSGATLIAHLEAIGALDGVQVAAVGGLNGPGRGLLKLGYNGRLLSWRAPGSRTFGTAIDVTAGGSFTVCDGENEDTWLAVQVDTDWLPDGPQAAEIRLLDLYANELVNNSQYETPAEIETWTVTLSNTHSLDDMTDTAVWLDYDCTKHVLISWNGTDWYTPRTEAAATAGMGTQTVTAGGTKTLYIRRIIPGAAGGDPHVLLALRVAWDDTTGGRAYARGRGLYRVKGTAQYRFYRRQDGVPVPGIDAVWATAASLPNTPAGTFADATWYICVTYFDGFTESSPLTTFRLDISAGALGPAPPGGPSKWQLQRKAGGVIDVVGLYWPEPDGDDAADYWRIWYTTNGSEPDPAGAPDYSIAMTFVRGAAVLRKSLPGQGHGTTVKALLRSYRDGDSIASENATSKSTTADATGPGAPRKKQLGAIPGGLP